jgi:hypothetical protein
MDHTPGQGQYRNLEIYRKALKGYRGLNDAAIDEMIRRSQGREKATIERIAELAERARSVGVAVASHDDDSVETFLLLLALKVRYPDRITLIRGNHDARSPVARELRLPPNVHEFPAGRAETVTPPALGVALHGGNLCDGECGRKRKPRRV